MLVIEGISPPPLLGLIRPFCFGWIANAQFYFGNGDSTATIHSFYSAVSCLCRGQWIHWWKGRIGDSTPKVSTLSFLINQEPEVYLIKFSKTNITIPLQLQCCWILSRKSGEKCKIISPLSTMSSIWTARHERKTKNLPFKHNSFDET